MWPFSVSRIFLIACHKKFWSADIVWFLSGISYNNNSIYLWISFHTSLKALQKDTSSKVEKEKQKELLDEVKENLFDSICSLIYFGLYLTDCVFLGNNIWSVNW